MPKIIIADDHPVVRVGFRQILKIHCGYEDVDYAVNGYELLEKVKKNKYDLVVLDLVMPGIDGLDVLKEIKVKVPGLRILIFTAFLENQLGLRALKAGADGFLNKLCDPDEIVEAVNQVLCGGKYISEKLSGIILNKINDDKNKDMLEILTDREYQVMYMLVKGSSIDDIAIKLSLSTNTISTYKRHILDKMKMDSLAELTQYALKNKLID